MHVAALAKGGQVFVWSKTGASANSDLSTADTFQLAWKNVITHDSNAGCNFSADSNSLLILNQAKLD